MKNDVFKFLVWIWGAFLVVLGGGALKKIIDNKVPMISQTIDSWVNKV